MKFDSSGANVIVLGKPLLDSLLNSAVVKYAFYNASNHLLDVTVCCQCYQLLLSVF